MNPRYAVFVDVETGGLDPDVNPLLEIGAVVVDLEARKILEGEDNVFEIRLLPVDGKLITRQAAEINGYDSKTWRGYVPFIGIEMFCQFVKKYWGEGSIFAGHNTHFDKGFVDFALKKYGYKNPFTSYHIICTTSVARGALKDKCPDRPSLENLCYLLGIEGEPSIHRAVNGARKAAEVYIKLIS